MTEEYIITKINIQGYKQVQGYKQDSPKTYSSPMIDRPSTHGYYRTDGTYVRPHYCSRPRS